MDALEFAKDKMSKTEAALKRELSVMRAGRANPQVLERIFVDYYGTPTPINQVGNISSPEARQLVISPYDPSMIGAIDKAIQKSDLGIHPSNDGKYIRLIFPELTEERRRELVKSVKRIGEEAKVAVRNIRRDALETSRRSQKAGEITEDDLKKTEDQVQKQTDAAIKEIERILADKEKEIMQV